MVPHPEVKRMRSGSWTCFVALVLLSSSLRAGEPAPPGTALLKGDLLVQLQVLDLDRSIRFYTGVLGCRMTERRDDLQFAHVDCGLPGLQLGLSAGGGPQPPSAGTVVLNFSIRGDVEKARLALERQGVVFSGPTRVIPGKVRLAGFKDPDGYSLRLAGEDKSAN
jgi:catechol 2,3-dioxygenase-like lactoylglutathione lyase family enzyme